MNGHESTTPFGRRPLSLVMVASQMDASACPPDATVHKWHVFRDICEARQVLGATERALSVLNALLSFHPDTALTGDGELIVFPSNAQLALRSHGMAPATLRRHLASLVECGLVIRRDSPNGKRYVRRGQGGVIEQAFGFDLTPVVARADEFARLAEERRAERRTVKLVRERITLCRRDIAKMIALGDEERIKGDWKRFHATFLELVSRIPRVASCDALEPIAQELERLAAEIRQILESQVKSNEMSANESQSERHIQNSNPDLSSRIEPGFAGSRGEMAEIMPEAPRAPQAAFPLGMVLDACPDIAMYRKDGISNWSDLEAAADLVRSILGISPSAYDDAREVMGSRDAAVVVAAILQRAEAISSAGGYIRRLTEKARAGEFSLGPVLMALLRARTRERMSA